MLQIGAFQEIDYVCSIDPAVDDKHPDYDLTQYLKTFDSKYCPIKADSDPTVFHLRRLTRKQYLEVARADKGASHQVAVSYGLRRVTNLKDGTGNDIQLSFKNGGDRIGDECLERFFVPGLIEELGTVIISLSRLSPLDK